MRAAKSIAEPVSHQGYVQECRRGATDQSMNGSEAAAALKAHAIAALTHENWNLGVV